MALRFDKASLQGPRIDHNGYLQAHAHVTRVGVFTYRHPDGSVTRELRHPDDVFKADSLASLATRPIVDEHPVSGRVDAKNTRHLAVGFAGEQVDHDHRFVRAPITVHDQAVIDKVMDSERPKRELSCGYSAEVIPESGTYNGEHYDHRQTNITYNHIALVWRGRAGHDVRIKLDAADAVADELGEDEGAKQDDHTIGQTRTGKTISADADNPNHGSFTRDEHLEARDAHVKLAEAAEFLAESGSDNEGRPLEDWVREKAKDTANYHRAQAKLHEAYGNGNPRHPHHPSNFGKIDHQDSKEDVTMLKLRRELFSTESGTFKVDGFEIEIPDDARHVVEGLLEKYDAALAEVKRLDGEHQTALGKADELERAKTELQGKLDESNRGPAPEVLHELAKERADIEGVAHYVGLKEYERLDNAALKAEIVKAKCPEVKLDGVSTDYVNGRFEAVCDSIRAEKKGLESLAALKDIATARPETRRDGSPGGAGDGEPSPRESFLQRTDGMHRLSAEERHKRFGT